MFDTTLSENNWRTAEQINSAMGRVYANMTLAVITSMVVSWLVSTSPALIQVLFTSPVKYLVMFAPLVAMLIAGFAFDRMTKSQIQFFLHGFAALMGVSFSVIFVVFTLGSIASAFFGASILFAVMSVYGYFTKRDLTGIGQFMIVGLIAIIIASIINIFIGSTVMQMVISAIAIIIFLVLTAYDTQRIRELISYDNDGKQEIIGALSLYLNFINIFLNLLSLFGTRNE